MSASLINHISSLVPGSVVGGKGKKKIASEANVAIVWGGGIVTPPRPQLGSPRLRIFQNSPRFFSFSPDYETWSRAITFRFSHFVSLFFSDLPLNSFGLELGIFLNPQEPQCDEN